MNTKDFIRLGIPLGEATRRATDFVSQFILSGGDKTRLEEEVKAIVANPALFAEDPLRKELAKAIVNAPPPPRACDQPSENKQRPRRADAPAFTMKLFITFSLVLNSGARHRARASRPSPLPLLLF